MALRVSEASVAISKDCVKNMRLPRRYTPRNDGFMGHFLAAAAVMGWDGLAVNNLG
jgi:hypothetical protein